MVTLNSIYKEVMSDEVISGYVKEVEPEFILNLVLPEHEGKTLGELKHEVKMPWGSGFPAEDFIAAANFALELYEKKTYEILPLWKEVTGQNIGSEETVYLIAPTDKLCEQGAKKPVVLICPGGGYENVVLPGEGLAYAKYMEEAGYVPFVLRYRVAPDAYPYPQQDLALAIKYIRKNAEKYGIDAENLLLMGSSAGGHLVSIVSAFPDEFDKGVMQELEKRNAEIAAAYREIPVRPKKLSLSYAALTFMDCSDDDSCYKCMTGGRTDMKEKVSVERHIDEDYPKTFLWFCEDDALILPKHGRLMYQALKEKNVECMKCEYPTGGHGCGLAKDTSAEGWIDTMLEFMKEE